MCYYAFIRYACGCAPLTPILVPTGLFCPRTCHDKRPTETNYTNHKYLDYNCNACQATRDLNGRPRRSSLSREARRVQTWTDPRAVRGCTPSAKEPSKRILTGAAADAFAAREAARDPGNWIDEGEGKFRRKNARDRKEDERIARRAEWAAASRRRQKEREEEDERERRRARY